MPFQVVMKKTQLAIGNTRWIKLNNRIESLRFYLEKQCGGDPFYKAYKWIMNPGNENDKDSELVKILGKGNVKFITLIYQLIVCEENYYGSQ